jgi:hypothetical protein
LPVYLNVYNLNKQPEIIYDKEMKKYYIVNLPHIDNIVDYYKKQNTNFLKSKITKLKTTKEM